MKNKRLISLLLCLIFGSTQPSIAMDDDDPLLTKVMSEFEYLPGKEHGVLEWDLDAWVGRDLYKFWVKTSGEHAGGEVEEANIEFVYSRAVYTTWDQQFGVRHDVKPDHSGLAHNDRLAKARNWISYGYIGTAPYFVEVDARLFVGEESSSQLLIELEREIMLTQEWVLTPEIELVANGRTNANYGEGSGLAEIEFGLRLGYERNGNRKFQPFVGLVAKQTFGGTRRFEKAEGNSSGDVEAMIGIHSWF